MAQTLEDLLGHMKNQFNKSVSLNIMDTEAVVPELKIDQDVIEPSPAETEKDRDIRETIEETIQNANILNEGINEKRSPANITKPKITKTVPQRAKRTSKRRPTQSSKSIIQSAIARKEKSFVDYLKPQSKTSTKPVKSKEGEKNEASSNSQNLNQKKTVQSNNKKVKRVQTDVDKNNLENDFSLGTSQEIDHSLRRSQRTLSSDNKGETVSVDPISEEEDFLKAQLKSRLCKCTENKGIFMETDTDSQFCTAVDSISDKLIGCSRQVDVKTVPLHRPSARVPFSLFCNAHIQRLIRHNCCPTCGVFCTQGQFAECPFKHHFHKDCQLSLENLKCCPHCGDFSPSIDIVINMYSSKKPVFLPVQRSHQ